MAVDIPSSVIRKLQHDLRAAAGLSDYDPDDPGLSVTRRTLRETIAEFDPSPSSLRCDQCRGKLLRGIKSMVCVYCGARQRREGAASPSISFNTTTAYRKLLESLQLDGSEAVVLGPDKTNSSGSQNVSTGSLTLSDFLDLKLKGPDYSSQIGNSTNKASNPSASSMNLAGIDLDNYFLDSSIEAAPIVSNKELGKTTNMPVYSQDSTEMVQEYQPAVKAVESINNVTGQSIDSSSGWEADFQSASSGSLHPDSKPTDTLKVSTVELGGPSESASVTDPITYGKGSREEPNSAVGSFLSNWPQNDQWSSGGIMASPSAEPFETSSKNVSAMMDNLFQDGAEHRKNTSVPINAETQDPFSFSWPQYGSGITASNRSANISMGLIDDSHEVSLEAFSQPHHQSMSTSISKDGVFPDLFQMGVSLPERMKETEDISRIDAKPSGVANKVETSTSTDTSVNADVEMLISQMHDLSFMLEDKLAIPEKFEDTNSFL
ncbi:hypothetical protein H6P81_000519 [Aristolochia fimbriata]|uniref:DUF7815 domain-containing protein n=1 Tax=Aristolochia fimbriata TaxID=158543 RepID=A0AAV7F7E2_ARIFI|nr:hypothetical protein H6P81_000519 [Aristolochia fimbriata]